MRCCRRMALRCGTEVALWGVSVGLGDGAGSGWFRGCGAVSRWRAVRHRPRRAMLRAGAAAQRAVRSEGDVSVRMFACASVRAFVRMRTRAARHTHYHTTTQLLLPMPPPVAVPTTLPEARPPPLSLHRTRGRACACACMSARRAHVRVRVRAFLCVNKSLCGCANARACACTVPWECLRVRTSSCLGVRQPVCVRPIFSV